MHEEALLRDLMRKIEEIARANGSVRVRRVRVWIGALSHLSEQQLCRGWSDRTQGTVAEGSVVEVELSHDRTDPRAMGVVLKSIDTEDEPPPR